MKKIITYMSVLFFALGIFSSVVHAQTFNTDPRDMATVLVKNLSQGTCNAGAVDGCWTPSVSASAGDTIAVHLYYHNTSGVSASNVALGFNPQSTGANTFHTLRGGILVNGSPVRTGSATVQLSSSQTLTYIPGSARWFPNQTTSGRAISGDSSLFDNMGYSIGSVASGWPGQGSMVIHYRVSNTQTPPPYNPPVYYYACNDGYDNDNDGLRDYPNDPGCYGPTDSDEYNAVMSQPQAITTVPTLVGQNSAQLNGLAVLNSTGSGTTWFEWGTTPSLGNRTTNQTINQSGSVQVSDGIIGLLPNTRYYYRIGVTNQFGTVYGLPVSFVTAQRTTTVVNPPSPQPVRTVVVARSAPSLLELRIESVYTNMCVNGDLEYKVYYRNISSQTLENTVLRVTLPKELTYIQANRGKYEVIDRTLTIDLGEVRAGEQGEVTLRARVNREAVVGNLSVATATVVYTNTISRAQEDAIAYSLITVTDDCPNLLGASAFGIWSFLPNTLIEWLLLILIILALIVLVRQMTKKKEA